MIGHFKVLKLLIYYNPLDLKTSNALNLQNSF